MEKKDTKTTAEEYIERKSFGRLGESEKVTVKDALEACELSREEAIKEMLNKSIELIGSAKIYGVTPKGIGYDMGLTQAIVLLKKLMKGE